MKKLLSFLLVPLIILGLAALDVKLAARSLLNPRRVQAVLTQLLGPEFSIRRIAYGLDGIQVKGLRVPSRLGTPDGRLLDVERIALAFSKTALLQGQLLPTDICLDSPRITLLRTAAGEWEIAELFKNLSKGDAAQPPAPSPLADWAPALTINNAMLAIADKKIFAPGRTQVFSDVNIRFIPFSQQRFIVEGEANAGVLGHWRLKGEIDSRTGGFRLTVAIPHMRLDRALAEMLNDEVRSSWDNFLPNGSADLTLEIAYAPEISPTPVITAILDCGTPDDDLAVNFKYVNFAYPTRAVAGRVEIRPGGARLIGLECHTAPSTILRVDGGTDGYERDAAVDLRVDVEGMALNDDLKLALDPGAQRAWDLFEPNGLVDGIARIHRPRGFNVPEVDDVTILCRNIHLRFRNFPYALDDCVGEIQFFGKEIHVKHLTGRHGDAEVRLRGDIFDISGDTRWDVHADAVRVPLAEDLRSALHPNLRSLWDEYEPNGTVDLSWHTFREEGIGHPERHDVVIRCRSVGATYRDIPYPLQNITGEIEYAEGSRVELRNLRGERGRTVIGLNGTVELDTASGDTPITPPEAGVEPPAANGHGNGHAVGNGGGGNGHTNGNGNGNGHGNGNRTGWDLTVTATDLALDNTLRYAVSSRLEETWQMFEPAGTVDLIWQSRRPKGLGTKETQYCRAQAKGVLATFREIPYPVPNLQGEIEYTGNTVRISNLRGRNGNEEILIDGSVHLHDEQPPSLDVTIKGSEVPLDAKLIDAVPKELGEILSSVTPSGSVDFALKCARQYAERPAGVEPPPGALPRWASEVHYSANVKFMDCAFDVGLKITDAFGALVIQGNVFEKEHDSLGSATFSQMKLEGKRFADATSQFLFKDHWLNLHDLSANAYKGLLTGNVRMNTESYAFDGACNLAGLDLRSFSRDTFISGKDVSGSLGAEVRFSGLGKDPNQLAAEGKVAIAQGILWDVPIFLNLLSSLNVQRRQDPQTGSVVFSAANGEIRIRSLEFDSDNMAITGKGSMDFDGNMDLLLDTGVSIAMIPEMPIITQIVGTIRKQLFAVEVKGPFKSPSVGARLLPSLGGSSSERKRAPAGPAGPHPAEVSPPPRRGRD
ncbi:MAG: hypothetical protein HZA54_02460 [Planctomycetes bacterium]|nr:hypothetical protein [Planctomycetota bacterium]